MNMKKLISLILAALMCMATVAALAEDDLQAQLDAANARIAELESEVELYKPFYENQIVAEYGDGGIIWKEAADAEYQAASEAYAQYGLNIDDYAADIKQDILQTLVRNAILDEKAAEMGISEISDEERANLEAEAVEQFETYVETYKSYFADENADEETAREQTIAAMESYGLTQDVLTQQMLESYVDEQLHNAITKDVAVTDEDIQAEYQKMVADDEEAYADDDYSYNNARNSGEAIAWNPEGYRAVKHVLIQFDEDQSAKYSELHSRLDELKAEKDAVENPVVEDGAEGAEGEEAEAAEEAEVAEEAEADLDIEAEEVEGEEEDLDIEVEEVEGEEEDVEIEVEDEEEDVEADEAEETEAPEPTPEPRSLDEIEADIASVTAEIEALHAELLPQAQQVIDEFNGGADFDSLIEKYNADPGMTKEPTASQGYAVSANSTTWDPAFTEGAMSIAEVGQISAPVYGMNGIHIIYYLADITPGAVPFEELAETAEANALEQKIADTYENQVNAWVEEANPVYHADRF